MTATVALRNVRGPQLVDISLHHNLYCERGGSCGCTASQAATLDRRYKAAADDATRGRMVVQYQNRVASASITIPRGEEVGGLHPVVLRLPAVASAIQTGLITSRYEELDSPAPPEVKETPTAPPEGPSRRRARS